MNTIKIDLHTHSIVSPDGGITEEEYKKLLADGILDAIAITDHNRIDFALELHRQLGDKIIVGEEIMTSDGEMIGLFLQREIVADQTVEDTAKQIRKQGGLVLIPHPFETTRKGIKRSTIEDIYHLIDVIEVFNGRSLQPKTREAALEVVKKYRFAPVCDSDAHCRIGIGRTYSMIESVPDTKTLINLLNKGERHEQAAPWLSYLCPKVNRFVKGLGLRSF